MTNCLDIVRNGILLLIIIGMHTQAWAQKGKKGSKEKVPVFNYVIDDPMDKFGREPVPPDVVHTVLMPDFYKRGEQVAGDTVLKYECFDAANEPIDPDTMRDHTHLRYVSLIQRYTNAGHTYKDQSGKSLPLPTEKIIYRYDKTGVDKWFSINYANNKPAVLQEFASEIVRSDSSRKIDPARGNYIITVYNYYKVVRVNN